MRLPSKDPCKGPWHCQYAQNHQELFFYGIGRLITVIQARSLHQCDGSAVSSDCGLRSCDHMSLSVFLIGKGGCSSFVEAQRLNILFVISSCPSPGSKSSCGIGVGMINYDFAPSVRGWHRTRLVLQHIEISSACSASTYQGVRWSYIMPSQGSVLQSKFN